jgi:glycosyltransferase involved in cell wall biosynthesis
MAKEWVRPYYLKWIYSRLFRERYPAEFKECWRYPVQPIESTMEPWAGEIGAQPDVLFLPAADWHTRIQRSQHLACELIQRGHRCFYLNPHLGREFLHPYPVSPGPVLSRLLPGVFELHVHLPREPVYHQRCLDASETAKVSSAIERLLDSAGSASPIIVVSLPLWSGVAQHLKERRGCRVIYDCHDLWEGFRNFGSSVLAAESDLFALSDSVLFSAQWLMEEKSQKHRVSGKSMLLRNAVRAHDFDFLYRSGRAGRKTVGYVGSLNFWFDTDSIRVAAERHPEWDFVLLGRIEEPRVHDLRVLRNVHLMGEVPYSTLRYHFASMDVCVIPFKISPLTLATNPLKLYEYFACGHPVVTSPLPEAREFGDLVYIAGSPEEFADQLEAAMEENDPALAAQRRLVAECESWSARCTSLVSQFTEPEGEGMHGSPAYRANGEVPAAAGGR